MQQTLFLKPQDIALLVKLFCKQNQEWRQVDLAFEMELSQGEIAKALARLNQAQLVHEKKPIVKASLEFLIYGFKYAFPVQLGALSFGVPTALSASVHQKMVVQNPDDVYVWPSIQGKTRGQTIAPLYPKLAEAALKDQKFYDLMATLEIIRIGRARERKLAQTYLEKKLKNL